MSRKLRGDVSRLSEALANSPQVSSITLDEQTVIIKLLLPSGQEIRLSIVYTEADCYPKCGLLLLCDEDHDFAEVLQTLSQTQFQDKAPLTDVLNQVRPLRA